MKKKNRIPKWIIYCIPVLFLMALEFSSVYRTIDNVIKDLAYQSTGQADPRVSVIGIDEETLDAYGNIEVWGRSKLADLINYLMEDPETAPAVIAVDIGIYSHKDQAEDERLVEAVRNAGNVILVSAVSFENKIETVGSSYTASQAASRIEVPFDELYEAARDIGHSNIFLDDDGYARHALGSLEVNGRKVSSFATAVAKAYTGSVDSRFDEAAKSFYIAYSGLPGDYFGSLGNGTSFKRVLEGEVPRQVFRDNIVFIGAYASGMQDHYYTTTNQASMMNGVEIQANIAAQIINGLYYYEANLWVRLLFIALLGISACILFCRMNYQKSMLAAFGIAAGYLLWALAAYYLCRIVLPILSPVLVLIIPCIIRTIIEYLSMQQERQQLVTNFSRYLPRNVAEKVARTAGEGAEDNLFPGEMRDIAVLFVDIRDFTTMSEDMEPKQVAHMINSFLSVTTEAVFQNGGTVDKFIGDCTMALFNAPLNQEDYVFKAVCTGLDILKQIGKIPVLPDDPEKTVRVGIGIDCGSALVGNIGTRYRLDYTAIGDTVNTASRIEGCAGPGELLISANVYDRLKDRLECSYHSSVLLKGKRKTTAMYLVTGIKTPGEETE